MAEDTSIVIIGNLCEDPTMRFTSSGVAVTNFRVASTPRILDKTSGEWKDGEPLFLACSIWRQPAENVAESLVRGMRVIVHGKLKMRSYTTKEGEKRTSIEVDVDEVGPSLKFATATVQKAGRSSGSGNGRPAAPDNASDDPWAPAKVGAGSRYDFGSEDPPF